MFALSGGMNARAHEHPIKGFIVTLNALEPQSGAVIAPMIESFPWPQRVTALSVSHFAKIGNKISL